MRRIVGLFLVCLLVLGGFCPAAFAAEKPEVAAVRVAAHDGVTRFVMELSDHITFQVGQVAGQVSIDLPDLDWSQSGKKGMGKPVGVLRNWSYGPAGGGKGRILFETDGQAGVKKAFIMPPNDEGNYRLVIDLSADAPSPPPSPPVAAAEQPRIQLHRPGQPAVATPPSPPVTQASAPKVMAMTTGNPILTSVETPSQPVAAKPTAPKPVADSKTADDSDSEDAADAPKPAEEPVAATTSGVLKHPAGGTKVAAGPMPPPVPPPARPVPQPASVTTTEPPAAPSKVPNAKPVVVIDPGHGGVDPGATSLSGAFEKNIVLALGLEVRDILNRNGKVQAIMTRDSDFFIPLRERVAIARAHHADLFMSLHADTVTDPTIRGLSVYTLSQNASDAEAQALADKENKSDIVAGIDLSNESAEVTNILIDLVQRESMNKSAVFATDIIHSVQRETHNVLEVNTHRFAGFAVLKAPDIPSVLVENGYLSNVQDEQNLRKSEYRAKLATALAKAIEGYFTEAKRIKKR
jgi:N-acetylmuramoyl-L-alanine amidase